MKIINRYKIGDESQNSALAMEMKEIKIKKDKFVEDFVSCGRFCVFVYFSRHQAPVYLYIAVFFLSWNLRTSKI